MPQPVAHKVTKSDKVIQIAKKYGHKDWKIIWKDPKNKPLVKKRKDPEGIQPGDVVVIPPTQKELAEAAKYATELQEAMIAEMAHETYCLKFAKQFSKLAEINKTSAKSCKKSYDDLIWKTKYVAGCADGTSADVDFVNDVIGLFMTGMSVATSGAKAATVERKAQAAAEKDFSKAITQASISPIHKHAYAETTKFLEKSAKSGSQSALFAAEAMKAFDNMKKPSFWGQAIARYSQGASWADVTTTDIKAVTKELKAAAKKLEKDRDTFVANYLKTAKALAERSKEMTLAAKRAKANFKATEKQLKSLV